MSFRLGIGVQIREGEGTEKEDLKKKGKRCEETSGQRKEVAQGLGNSVSAGSLGEIATFFFNLGEDLLVGVAGACQVMTIATLKHGEVVEVVPGNKSRSRSQVEKRLNVSQTGALVVIGMGKPEVWTVADGQNLGPVPENFFHQLFGMGNRGIRFDHQADGADIWDYGDVLVGAYFLFDPFEDSPMPAEQGLVDLGAGFVPCLDGLSFTVFDPVNFPLHGYDPFRKSGRVVLDKGLPQALPRAARGHDPRNVAFFTGGLQPEEEAGSEGGGRILVGQGAVKISANEKGVQCGRFSS